jgi:DNA-binding SARP family transcriptional activator
MDSIQLLGATTACIAGRRVAGRDFGGTKVRQVLEVLALTPGRPVAKDLLAELLWDGAPPPSWRTTLEAYVSQLRRVLGPSVPVRQSLVVTTAGAYKLDAERVVVDLAGFADQVRRCSALPDAEALPALQAALDTVSGVALADEPYATWAVEAREAHERLLLQAVLRAGDLALDAGQPRIAAGLAHRATDSEPLDERGWRLRMQAAWADGDPRSAQAAYDQCRDRLHRELGLAPAPLTQQLHRRLLAPAGGDVVDSLLGQLVDVLLAEGGWAADDPGHQLDQRTLLDTNALAARIARAVHARTSHARTSQALISPARQARTAHPAVSTAA